MTINVDQAFRNKYKHLDKASMSSCVIQCNVIENWMCIFIEQVLKNLYHFLPPKVRYYFTILLKESMIFFTFQHRFVSKCLLLQLYKKRYITLPLLLHGHPIYKRIQNHGPFFGWWLFIYNPLLSTPS